eukprot:4718700-Prorocentrum_lima.AAC.1
MEASSSPSPWGWLLRHALKRKAADCAALHLTRPTRQQCRKLIWCNSVTRSVSSSAGAITASRRTR